jgi:hypothetical protein
VREIIVQYSDYKDITLATQEGKPINIYLPKGFGLNEALLGLDSLYGTGIIPDRIHFQEFVKAILLFFRQIHSEQKYDVKSPSERKATSSVDNTLDERGKRYGDFTDHARIAQALQNCMRGTQGWTRLSDVQKQALTVIADKIARVLNGDPNYADNWHDLAGYSKLVEDRLP